MSILTIYQTHLTPERNALVDELDWYLENEAIQTFKFEEFQYQKLEEALTLTIRADQSDITNQRVGNYLTITQDGKTWYYFIMSYVWTAANAITLYTVIDSVNTFRNDVEWSRKTTIARQHEDRFSITENSSLVRKIDIMSEGIETNKYIIEDTKLQQSADELDWFLVYRTQNDEGVVAEENIPFDTFLCASQPLAIDLQGTPTESTSITAETLEGKYEAILNKDNSIAVLSLPSHVAYDRYEMRDLRVNDRILLVGYYPVPLQGRTYVGFEILVKNILLHKQDNGKIGWYINWSDPILKYLGTEYYMTMDIENIPYDFSDTNYFVLNLPYDYYPDKIENNNNESLYDRRCGEEDSILIKALKNTRIVSDDLPIEEIIEGNLPKHEYNIGLFATVSINSFEDIDRTLKPIMKILRLPYAPITIQYQDGRYIVPPSWEASTFSQIEGESLTLLKLKKSFFTDGFLSEVGSINLNNYLSYFPTVEEKLSNSPRNIAAESKLFSSEFLTLKFLYDSFSTSINLEQFQPNGGIYAQEWTLPIRYKQTNTTGSTFLFDLGFDKLYLSNPSVNLEYRRFNDYEQYLVVNRNNEEGLYQSDYLDYMRYGYNFDKKNTEQNVAQGWISAIFGLGGAGAQGAIAGQQARYGRLAQDPLESAAANALLKSPYKTTPSQTQAAAKVKLGQLQFGPAYLVGQAIQAGTQAVGSIINQSIATEQAYASLRQKQFELQQQDIGVQGADDIDLLKYYNDNRLHFIVYDTVDLQKEAAHNLFHYCGYSRAKQAIPNFTGRYWFNFIQCSPMFKSEELHPYNAFLDNIKARYENGITVYHRHYNAAGAGQSYDWEQEYENWEDNVVYQKYTTDMLESFGTTIRQTITYKGPTLDNYYAWIEIEDVDGNSLLNTKDTEGTIEYGRRWNFANVGRVRINTRQWEQASDWYTIGG